MRNFMAGSTQAPERTRQFAFQAQLEDPSLLSPLTLLCKARQPPAAPGLRRLPLPLRKAGAVPQRPAAAPSPWPAPCHRAPRHAPPAHISALYCTELVNESISAGRNAAQSLLFLCHCLHQPNL